MLLAAVVIVALLAIFARATLPGQRSELIGKWVNVADSKLYYEFRADGTFTALASQEWAIGNPNDLGRYEGKWRAGPAVIYLTYTKIESARKVKNQKAYDDAANRQIGQESKFDMKWPAKDMWEFPYHANQQYKKAR